ncbi:unnamed protein product [Discula destructiva]
MSSNLLKAASTALLLVQTQVPVVVAAAAAAASGSLCALSFNVAGLPAFLQDNGETGDKTTNTELIGTYFSEYDFDVIHVQEDFNYHAALYSTDTHPYRTATSGGAAFGSGLNTLANYPWVDFTRTKWDTCSNNESQDCLTPKGFTFMRLQISGSTETDSSSNSSTSVYIDVYNMHADAGVTDADEIARNSNLEQVLSYVDVWSTGNAVLIFGDTNSRYSRTADTAIRTLLGAGFIDAWVQRAREGVVPTVESLCDNPQAYGNTTCETVDKVLYRGSPLVALDAASFEYVSTWFLDASGSTLSDHNPVNVNLTWTAGTAVQQSGFWGGPHGTWFSDAETLAAIQKPVVSTLAFSGNERLDSVGVVLGDGTSLTHGGTGGNAASLDLEAGEYWISAQLCQGKFNDETRNFFILATTSKGKTLSAGTATSECVTFVAPTGWAIVGFLGQAGDEMDQLGFLYAPQ